MSDTFIIEVSSQPAGIVVRGPGGFQFFAATHRFNRLAAALLDLSRRPWRIGRQRSRDLRARRCRGRQFCRGNRRPHGGGRNGSRRGSRSRSRR